MKKLYYFDNIKNRIKEISAQFYKWIDKNIIAEPQDAHKIDFSKRGIKSFFVLPLRKLIIFVRQRREDYLRLIGPDEDAIKANMMFADDRFELVDEGNLEKSSLIFKLIFSFVAIAVLWASFTELDEVVRAEGVIVPPSSVQSIQSLLPGAVVEINVKLGDRVQRGDVLFRIEDQKVLADFDGNEITRVNAGAAVIRLEAELAGLEELVFPAEMYKSNPAAVENERKLFEQRKAALSDRLRVVQRNMSERRSEMITSRDMMSNLSEEILILEPLVEAGHESRLQLLEHRSELSRARGSYEQARLAIEKGQDEYNAIISEFKSQAATDLAEVRARSDQAGAYRQALTSQVDHAAIRAPLSGTVSAVYIKTLGGVVQAGEVMAEIVPDEQAVLVRARVSPENISDVRINQPANVALSSYDTARYGYLKGFVQQIASNTTQFDKELPFYETMIEIPVPRFSKMDMDVTIVPGMTVTVDLIGKKRTVMNYILTPIERASSIAFREN